MSMETPSISGGFMVEDPVLQVLELFPSPEIDSVDARLCRDNLTVGIGILTDLNVSQKQLDEDRQQLATPRFAYTHKGKVAGYVWLEGIKCVVPDTDQIDDVESFIVLKTAPSLTHQGSEVLILTGQKVSKVRNNMPVAGTIQDVNYVRGVFWRMKEVAKLSAEPA